MKYTRIKTVDTMYVFCYENIDVSTVFDGSSYEDLLKSVERQHYRDRKDTP